MYFKVFEECKVWWFHVNLFQVLSVLRSFICRLLIMIMMLFPKWCLLLNIVIKRWHQYQTVIFLSPCGSGNFMSVHQSLNCTCNYRFGHSSSISSLYTEPLGKNIMRKCTICSSLANGLGDSYISGFHRMTYSYLFFLCFRLRQGNIFDSLNKLSASILLRLSAILFCGKPWWNLFIFEFLSNNAFFA